jgi:hypothetical protein
MDGQMGKSQCFFPLQEKANGLVCQHVRLAGGWWLVLICSERKILLSSCWWLICSERKVLLAGG